jgi:hypothetical protein
MTQGGGKPLKFFEKISRQNSKTAKFLKQKNLGGFARTQRII